MWVLHRDVILCSLQAVAYLFSQARISSSTSRYLGTGTLHTVAIIESDTEEVNLTEGKPNTDLFRYQHHLELRLPSQRRYDDSLFFFHTKIVYHISRLHDATRDAFPFVASNFYHNPPN